MVVIPENYVSTAAVDFLCLVDLCIVLSQTEPAQLLVLAQSLRPSSVFQPTCIQTSRVLQSFQYTDRTHLRLIPTNPVPLEGPFPEAVPCGQFTVETYPVVVGPDQLAVIVTVTADFVFPVAQGNVVVTASATVVVIFTVTDADAKRGTWHVATAASCLQCVVIERPHLLGASQPGFSSITKVRNNTIHVPADDSGPTSGGRVRWQHWIQRAKNAWSAQFRRT